MGGLRLISSALIALLISSAAGQTAPDFTQAEAMVNLLRSCYANKTSGADLDHVLSLPGTELVIQQQNISRQVTPEQYRAVLQAACTGKIADIKPAATGARAQKGVTGLIQDVAPSLVWGRTHIAKLEASLKDLRNNREIGDAIPLAKKYLPEPIELNPKLYVVMGGRAGAAAIDDQLYFDVLITEWRASQSTAAPVSSKEVVEFFAHETHHLGYGQILDRKRAALKLSPAGNQAWNFLVATMMEGSATLLINGHQKLADLERQPDTNAYLTKVPELLPAMQKVLQRALGGPMSEEEYAEATGPFLNMGYHATGAVLLAAIEKKRGLSGLLRVMEDPRRLLAAYNESVSDSPDRFRFEAALAVRLASMGEPPAK